MASHSERIPVGAPRVAVVGAGVAGLAAAEAAAKAGAHVLLLDKAEAIRAPLPAAVTKAPGAFAVDLIVDGGSFVGVLVLEGGLFRVLRASSCVLATGGIDGLVARSALTGDGLAMAARVGAALEDLAEIEAGPEGARLAGGVAVRDHLTSIENLLAAGDVAAGSGSDPSRAAAAGRRAGELAATRRGLPPAPGHLHMRPPPIDTPLPPGFVDVKMDRLRAVVRSGLTDPAAAIPHVLRLKGEADDFARARAQPELYEFQNACEVAMLVLKARRG